ncbi:MAG: InlB B-repeat-containing protein, partial [Roseburia sp.]|nr:InlB B-repeat-containing protein [Roseburia sp.]
MKNRKKQRKRSFALALAFALCLGTLQQSVLAEETSGGAVPEERGTEAVIYVCDPEKLADLKKESEVSVLSEEYEVVLEAAQPAEESAEPVVSLAAEESAEPAVSPAAEESTEPAASPAAEESTEPAVSLAAEESAAASQPAEESTEPAVSSAAEESMEPAVSPTAEESASAAVSQPEEESAEPAVSPAAEESASANQPAEESTEPAVSPAAEESAVVSQPAEESTEPAVSPAAEESESAAQPEEESTDTEEDPAAIILLEDVIEVPEAERGSEANPCASLAEAVDLGDDRPEPNITIILMSDLTMTECARINGKNVTIKGNGYTITRGDNFETISDTQRSWYNPAMIEVCDSKDNPKASLRLENITLDDGGKTAGTIYKQAAVDNTSSSEIVQDAIIATYNGTWGPVGTITLGNNVTLKGYGGMSAVRLSAGTLIMESGSKITGGKKFTTKGQGGYGPAGAVWIQGGSLIMNEGAEISDLIGRAVYLDSGSAVISGTIRNITANSNMWQGAEGVGLHVRNRGKAVLNGTIDGGKQATTAVVITEAESVFTMNKGAVIRDLKKAISAGSNSEVIVNGEITGLFSGGNAVNMSGAKCTVGPDAEIHHNDTWRSTIYCQSGELHIYGYFHHNYNGNDRSGAIEINNNGSGSKAYIYDGARITDNYCKETGGGIMVTNGLLTMYGGEISGNVAGTYGGGISVRKGGRFIMEGGRITGNASAQNGGGVSYEATDWNGYAYVDLRGGEISGNKMNAAITLDKANCTATFTGGVDNDLAVSTGDGPATAERYFVVGSDVAANRNIYMSVDSKTVTVTDGTKLGNALGNDINDLKNKGKSWGFGEPKATLWVQNAKGASVTVSGLKLDTEKPVWVLVKNDGKITRIPAALENGVVSFQAPASESGCALAVVQPADGDVVVTLTSELTRVVENKKNDSYTIPYEVVYGLKDGAADVLTNAQDVKVTFLLPSGEEIPVPAEGNRAALDAEFDAESFKAGESIVVGAVLTFKNNDKEYMFYSNNVSLRMIAVYTVTFDSKGGSPVAEQEVVDGDKVSEPEAPVREGYTFDGWMLEGEAYDFETPVTGDITLVAAWAEVVNVYTVTFDSNGGSPVAEQEVVDGDKVSEPEAPVREGYTFGGWTLEGETYDFETPVTGDIT